MKAICKSKTARLLLLCLAALALLFAVWKVFFNESGSSAYVPTEREARLCTLLSGLKGVEDAKVMITEEDGIPTAAVVVFSGEDGILTRSRVIGIVSAALGIAGNKVQVYPAEK